MLSYINRKFKHIKRILRNIKQFYKLNYWDYSAVFEALYIVFSNMEQQYLDSKKRGWYHTTFDQDLKTIVTLKELSKRLLEQDYSTPFDKEAEELSNYLWSNVKEIILPNSNVQIELPEHINKDYIDLKFTHQEQQLKSDLQYFSKIFERKIRRLWI